MKYSNTIWAGPDPHASSVTLWLTPARTAEEDGRV